MLNFLHKYLYLLGGETPDLSEQEWTNRYLSDVDIYSCRHCLWTYSPISQKELRYPEEALLNFQMHKLILIPDMITSEIHSELSWLEVLLLLFMSVLAHLRPE